MDSTTRAQQGLSVAALARIAGTTTDTIRYYERLGLLPKAPRNGAGYRRYGTDAIDRMKFIQGTQRLGLRLSDIADLLSIRDTGACPCGDAAVVLRKRMDEVHTEVERLSALYGELAKMVEQLPSQQCPDPAPGVWKPQPAESA
ncbi:MerR family transcriptional regulator [Streptomyces sennicomposti]|uniref:MerR family transcriptional regulator n=1 Tax=Streptomyces sennicomposti TaxID=2873384 RepID=UPI001CA6099D|nr:MerR family transcriptional regulator [Streptomyces sennicomposti]MBY8864502.1 MerR family transcriptional regulator [Streptomyces sennicomposti]